MAYRECECCRCGHAWRHLVELAEATPNISGEKTAWCPNCKTRSYSAGPVTYEVGDRVTWRMADDNLMCGTIRFVGYSTFILARVDGSPCEIAFDRVLRPATYDDVMAAVEFFKDIGK